MPATSLFTYIAELEQRLATARAEVESYQAKHGPADPQMAHQKKYLTALNAEVDRLEFALNSAKAHLATGA